MPVRYEEPNGVMPGVRRRGLASAEIMIAAGVLIILVSILVPGTRYVRERALIKQARLDMIEVLVAGRKYHADYQKWPSEFAGEYGDYRYGLDLPNAHVMNILRAQVGPGNLDGASNPRRIVYLQPRAAGKHLSGLNGEGDLVDPWGMPYQIVVDTDLNNTCYIGQSTYRSQIGHGMVLWSCGPDKRSETRDDILSWQLRE